MKTLKTECDEIIERYVGRKQFMDDYGSAGDLEDCNIWDVFKNMYESDIKEDGVESFETYILLVSTHWKPFGFTTSLNEIFSGETDEFLAKEEVPEGVHWDGTSIEEQFKSKDTQALFTFLKNI